MVAEKKNNNTLNFPYSQPSRSALHIVILRRKRDSRIMKTQSGTTTQSNAAKCSVADPLNCTVQPYCTVTTLKRTGYAVVLLACSFT